MRPAKMAENALQGWRQGVAMQTIARQFSPGESFHALENNFVAAAAGRNVFPIFHPHRLFSRRKFFDL